MKKLLLSVFLAVVGLPALAQNAYPLFAPSNGIMKGDVNTYITSSATAADVLNLWTSCTATTFLRGDAVCVLVDLTANVTGTLPVLNGGTGVTALGTLTKVDDTNVTLTLGGTPANSLVRSVSVTAGWTGTLAAARGGLGFSTVTDDTIPIANGTIWQSKSIPNCTDTLGAHLNYDTSTNTVSCGTSGGGGFTGLANPTATIGLSAVNGVLSTAIRSDGAPALSQAIAPTWTANHTFTLSGTTALGAETATLSAARTVLGINETDQGVNGRLWNVQANGGILDMYASSDDGSVNRAFLSAVRSTNAISSLSLGNATDNPTYSFLGTGAATFNGSTNISAAAPTAFLTEAGAGADGKIWRDIVTGGTQFFDTRTDAGGAGRQWLSVARSGVAISSLNFGNATDNPSYSFLGTGTILTNAPFFRQTSANATYRMRNSSAAADAKVWDTTLSSGSYFLQALDDAEAVSRNALKFDRSGVALTALAFGNATDNPTYSFLGSGLTTFGAGITTGGVGRFIGSSAPVRLNAADTVGDVYIQAYSSDGTTSRWFVGDAGAADNNLTLSNDVSAATLTLQTTGNGPITLNAGSGAATITAGSLAAPATTTVGGVAVCRLDGTNCPSSTTTITCTTACNASTLAVGQVAFIRATGTPSVTSSTTMVSDSDLQYTNVPAGTYSLSGNITMTGGAGGAKFDFTSSGTFTTALSRVNLVFPFATGATCSAGSVANFAIFTLIASGSATGSYTCISFPGSGITAGVSEPGSLFVTTGAGTIAFQFAQNSSNVTPTNRTPGSYLLLRRLL